jgi:hypothetical protein
MKNKNSFAVYCGQTVQVLDTYSTEHGTISLVSYDDGREEELPTVRLDFLD